MSSAGIKLKQFQDFGIGLIDNFLRQMADSNSGVGDNPLAALLTNFMLGARAVVCCWLRKELHHIAYDSLARLQLANQVILSLMSDCFYLWSLFNRQSSIAPTASSIQYFRARSCFYQETFQNRGESGFWKLRVRLMVVNYI
jgi:hypothetical protein